MPSDSESPAMTETDPSKVTDEEQERTESPAAEAPEAKAGARPAMPSERFSASSVVDSIRELPLFNRQRVAEDRSRMGQTDLRKERDGNIVRYSTQALERPFLPPQRIVRASLVLALIAAVIGALFIFAYLEDVVNGPAREQEALEERIAKEVDLGLPNLPSLVSLDDASILARLQESGDVLYEKVPAGSTESPFEVIKLPPDVSLADAAVLYLKGVSSLSPSEAALLLNGSWDLVVNREQGINIGIHYADFASGSIERALSDAAHSQGFDTAAADVQSGEDTSGNTYLSGALDIEGTSYAWRVSAVPLSDVYSQNGLPEDAVYVGIRVYS